MRDSIMRLLKKALTLSAFSALFAGAAFAQVPVDGGIGLQEPATPVMEELVKFHNGFLMWTITIITLFVLALMIFIMFRFNEKANPVPSKTSHNTLIEVIWTIVPVLILLVMVVPSMKLLYMQDRIPETELTVKVVGNTWNWEYSYPEFENVDAFISNPLDKEASLAAGKPYLLGTDAPLVVPVNKKVKVLVTSNNNLHAFAVPAFGVKIDSVPGRINETWFQVTKEGTFYGQCSELCGINHYYMPIEVQVVSEARFNQWIANGGAFTNTVADNTSGGAGTTAAQK